jgi:hypothetical protein
VAHPGLARLAGLLEEAGAAVSPAEFNRAVGITACKAWGLDPMDVLTIDLHWHPYDISTATLELRINERVIGEILSFLRSADFT